MDLLLQMADRTSSSTLPLPPQFAELYTDENIQQGKAPSPPKPVVGVYEIFGTSIDPDEPMIRPLESQGIKRLHPLTYDRKQELKKLNHSILVNFLDMLEVLIQCPDSKERIEKMDDISLIFVHMHHLINEFRPHQAREALRFVKFCH